MSRSHRASKEISYFRNLTRGVAVLGISGLALTACASETGDTASPVEPSTSASRSVPQSELTIVASTPPVTPVPTTRTARVIARVCDGFFTQKTADGMVEVIGRPAVDDQGHPLDVEVNQTGVEVLPLESRAGETQWYDMYGKTVSGIGDITCRAQTLRARELTQPNGSHIWVATSNSHQPTPRTWDAVALDPAGFGGVALDYGSMSSFDLGDVLGQAQRHHDHPPSVTPAS